ncbi:dienelactone hydrolase [Massilia sp. WF1]|uniref:dienelactone hydrolase family protein n=1 Tax=unclassified Massilia TaxID=2609279 RepID=UPI0006494034|nr:MULTISPECIES: prolyl oligopeptidase family serine peptidase [unclassified Massilia]ALK98174.1 dienelactone hydrolase [Massilia sp. WG5]KLU37252.1 dienelactone hydrolase [Massilia sp. WF1]
MSRARASVRKLTTALIVGLALLPGLSVEQELQLDYRINEHIMLIPAGQNHEARLETTVFQPNGPGPFPLIIINHGKDPGHPNLQPRDRFYHMAHAFVARGYAVMVPMRQGFANSTGRYRDRGCDMTANGYIQAEDIRATLEFAREQKWIDADRIVVAGQSYGGLATMALGTQELPGVRALLNFAGGLRDDSNSCGWRSSLVSAFAEYGAQNKIPSLWMYGANDSLFGPELVARMHDAFEQAGGKAQLVEYAAFKRDSHGMLASRDGEKVWLADTMRFLDQVGMPTKVLYKVPEPPLPQPTNFASIGDVASVPFLSENGKRAYAEYLTKMTPRAFAVSPSGAWCWAEEGEDPEARALATCSAKSDKPCRLYSVDESVVWNPDLAEKAAVTASNTPAPAPATSSDGAGTAQLGSTAVVAN